MKIILKLFLFLFLILISFISGVSALNGGTAAIVCLPISSISFTLAILMVAYKKKKTY